MPFQLTTPKPVGPQIERLEIARVEIDLEGQAIRVEYWVGYVQGGQFVKVEKRRHLIGGAEYAKAVGEPDGELAAGAASVYEAVKRALYRRIVAAEGVSGAVV